MTNKITKLMLNWEEYLIREYQEWWKPGANTIAYRPLNSTDTVSDLSGNWYRLRNNQTLYSSNWDSISFKNTSRSCSLYCEDIPIWQNYTICYWFKSAVTSSDDISCSYCVRTYISSTWCWQTLNHIYSSSNEDWIQQYVAKNNTTWDKYILPNIRTTRDWNMYTITKQGSTYKVYLNWALIATDTWYDDTRNATIYIGAWPLWNLFRWYISRFIIENKVWTDQNDLDYYNQTKSLYWIN